ncbi:MAG: hypothetical protein O7A08_00720 [SAR324 cluster bacterium]|nr:hypothetical protein [SAR324 cluster bacterium]MCZ6646784.1 hypothetical protein [SAR324 cluster bacterium]MCZ6728159.1 hypothetical protein [SAR324 cluster bacterium]MCZ6843493.1 hypothetical protein [SAR324 cluster bacterium]
MFELFGYLMEGFVWFWILIIGSIPNIFMGGLTACIGATVISYFVKKSKASE